MLMFISVWLIAGLVSGAMFLFSVVVTGDRVDFCHIKITGLVVLCGLMSLAVVVIFTLEEIRNKLLEKLTKEK